MMERLVTQASPLVSLPAAASALGLHTLLVKREDALRPEFGGCKVRSLEVQLAKAAAAGADTILIAARAGSNAVAAASLYAPRYGLRVHALLRPQVSSDTARFNLELIAAAGTVIVPVTPTTSLQRTAPAVRREMARLKRAGHRPYFISFGGGDVDAAAAQAPIIAEAWQQASAFGLSNIDRIYVAGASFSTAAGLLAGIALSGINTELVIVGLAHEEAPGPQFFSKVRRAANQVNRSNGHRRPALAIALPHFYCAFREAFGEVTPPLAIEALDEVAALRLDPVYTRKVFERLVADAAGFPGGRFLFWHTGNTAPWPEGLDRRPLSPELEKLLC